MSSWTGANLSPTEQYGDEPPNDTFELFLIEQRRVKEKQRLRLVGEKRKSARQQLNLQLSLTPEAEAERLKRAAQLERAEQSKAVEQLCKAKRTASRLERAARHEQTGAPQRVSTSASSGGARRSAGTLHMPRACICTCTCTMPHAPCPMRRHSHKRLTS